MKKYKVSKPKKKINFKLMIGFIAWSAVCLFGYIAAVRAFFAPITLIYIALIAVFAAAYVVLRFLSLSFEAKLGKEEAEKGGNKKLSAYKKAIKVVLFIGTPFLFSILIDYIMIILGIYEKL